ncbi:MAG: 50S ribosomal protein L39e [Candidatus Aramenus sulfurataquae]|uniref:Large ribosomal subunit protein eL39 n=2 Tax=Candidatus Aramenus sulfurataquae TaxID=1326980 RepID=W7KK59_9CREN|nr:MAG: 50S ribosomal protein L39e [Candidatus Aramenus sulfurataquae]MBW9140985.1 50S ribosomal protein L39e [Candidatus Aramenus sp.]MCI2414548.1 50S ribosomal protein L39e [Candidatus Aramenus sp.]MCL7343511.1 50S ribosomal protein L39e [Candidatus Aramenus sulfurataquae]
MSRNKPAGKKNRLARALKSNSPVPAWVVIRTNGKFRLNPIRRDWRRNDLKV